MLWDSSPGALSGKSVAVVFAVNVAVFCQCCCFFVVCCCCQCCFCCCCRFLFVNVVVFLSMLLLSGKSVG